jgi:beta-glucanase (GH16 family)
VARTTRCPGGPAIAGTQEVAGKPPFSSFPDSVWERNCQRDSVAPCRRPPRSQVAIGLFPAKLSFALVLSLLLPLVAHADIKPSVTAKGIVVDLGDTGTFNLEGPVLQVKDAAGKTQGIKPVFAPAPDGLTGAITYPGAPDNFQIAVTVSPADHAIQFHWDNSLPNTDGLQFAAQFDAGQFRGGGQFSVGGKQPMQPLPLLFDPATHDGGHVGQLDLAGRDGVGFTMKTPDGYAGFGDDRKFNPNAQTYSWNLQYRFDPTKDPNGVAFTIQDLKVTPLPQPPPLPPGPPPDGKWVPIPELTDDFDGTALDASKWYDHDPGWGGRSPSWFAPNNVTVADGKLKLLARLQDPPEALKKYPSFKNFSTACVVSKATALYGYFECKAKVMDLKVDSAFWFFTPLPTPPGCQHVEEMDCFEICGGGGPKFERTLFNTMHVWRTPETGDKKPWANFVYYRAPKRLADDYHVYGLEWDKDWIKCYFDGVLFSQYKNTNWYYPEDILFDNEIQGPWFGYPTADNFNSSFDVEYIHSWKRTDLPADATPADSAATGTPAATNAAPQ